MKRLSWLRRGCVRGVLRVPVHSDPTLFADLRAQGDGSTIGCRITVNGIVKDERSTNNVNGYIACLDKSA